MLGLASSLTSASIHEQMYSLLLDGTGDYLDTGSAFQSTHRGGFTYAFWMKPDDGQPGATTNILGTENTSNQDIFTIQLLTNGKFKILHTANNDGATYFTDAAVYADGAGDWKHICITVANDANTSYIIYVDGAAVAGSLTNAVAKAEHGAWTSSDNVYIGGENDNGTVTLPFAGKMDEVAIWNATLDVNAVAAVYNSGKPFDLNYDRGNYGNSSALQGYWRMFNGPFDDKVHGIVHDQSDPGFGGELWDGIDGDDANWSVYGSNTKEEDDGAVKITFVDNVNGAFMYLRESNDVSTNLTIGKTYKITFSAKINTGSCTWRVWTNKDNLPAEPLTSTTFIPQEIYFVATATTSNYLGISILASGEIMWIKNISLHKLNGNPAMTAANATYSTDTPDD